MELPNDLVIASGFSWRASDQLAEREPWLQSHPQWIQPRAGLALDMVHLEWAELEAFDGAAEPALTPQDLLASGPDPQFRLQPYLQLLRLRYPVDHLLPAIRENDSGSAMASNAVSEIRKPTGAGKVARQKPQAVFLAVHRIDNSVYFNGSKRTRSPFSRLFEKERACPLP